MSQDDVERIISAARRLRHREGAGFTLTQLARPAGMSRATLYRRLAADHALAGEIERIRYEGVPSPKEQFLTAATLLLTERGLSELTMEAVAERAGLSTATLYRTFSDREALIREVLRTSLPSDTLRQTLNGNDPIQVTLERFVSALQQRLHERPYLLRFLFLRTRVDDQEMRKFRREEDRLSTSLIRYFEKHHADFRPISPKQLAASLMGHVLGGFILERSHDGFVRPDPKTIVSLFLDGVRPQHEERTRS